MGGNRATVYIHCRSSNHDEWNSHIAVSFFTCKVADSRLYSLMNIFPLILTVKFICYKRRFHLLTIACVKKWTNFRVFFASYLFRSSIPPSAAQPWTRLSPSAAQPWTRLPLYRCQCHCLGEVGNEHILWNNSYGFFSNIFIKIKFFKAINENYF